MPTSLKLKPFIPSAHGDLIVETTQGRQPLQATAQYHDLVAAGVIDARGQVDNAVQDWMTVLGRAEREVVLTIRRPADPATDDCGPTVHERVLAICRYQRYLAMAARDGAEMVIGGVGEASAAAQQAELICNVLLPALGEHPPADITGINLPKAAIEHALAGTEGNPDRIALALRHLGLGPWEVDAVSAAMQLDKSAMAVIAVIDRDARVHVHPQVLTVADSDYGRISFTTSRGADGTEWLSIWPTNPAGLRQDLMNLIAVPQLA